MTKKQANHERNNVDNQRQNKGVQKNKITNNNNKAKSTQHTSMPHIFSISIFSCAQQLISTYLGIFFTQLTSLTIRSQFLSHLSALLLRTKSPPISLLYSYEFLSTQVQSQLQLLIIRFISQLSDISQGKSILSSLSFMNNGAFLTELRHNLTHRVMGKGLLIKKAKEIIVKELKQQYWQDMYQKIIQLYSIDMDKVKELYNQIIYQHNSNKQIDYFTMEIQHNQQFKSVVLQLNLRQQTKLTSQYLIKNTTLPLYEFKSNIKKYLHNIINRLISIQQNSSNQEEKNINLIQLDHNLIEQSILCIIEQKSANTIIKLIIMINQLIQTVLHTSHTFKNISIKLLTYLLTILHDKHKQLSTNMINHKVIIKKQELSIFQISQIIQWDYLGVAKRLCGRKGQTILVEKQNEMKRKLYSSDKIKIVEILQLKLYFHLYIYIFIYIYD